MAYILSCFEVPHGLAYSGRETKAGKRAAMRDRSSQDSIEEANRWHAEKSRHGGIGAAGYISSADTSAGFLSRRGEVAVINPHDGPFDDFIIGVAWEEIMVKPVRPGFFRRLFGGGQKKTKKFVDLDLGCIYEMKDGRKGALQGFGKNFGSLDAPPYIRLSGDERTGATIGNDEVITVSGVHWNEISRLLIYIYIYHGAETWEQIHPQIQVRVPGEAPMVVALRNHAPGMIICAVATVENVRGGIRMTNIMEHFPGHSSMDRAFGFGLPWEEGSKDA